MLQFFGLFLENYPAKSDIMGLIDISCWRLTFTIFYAQLLLEKSYRVNFQFNRETGNWEFSLLYRPRHALSRKKNTELNIAEVTELVIS